MVGLSCDNDHRQISPRLCLLEHLDNLEPIHFRHLKIKKN